MLHKNPNDRIETRELNEYIEKISVDKEFTYKIALFKSKKYININMNELNYI